MERQELIPRFEMANMEAFLQEMRGFANATTQAVTRLSEKKPGGTLETIDARTLQKPEVWRPKDHDDEMNGWPEWSFLFKTFMGMLDADYEQDLGLVENDLKKELKLEDYGEDYRVRARRLYSYLVSYVKGRPLRIVRAVTTSDGYKAWQHLCREFQPKTRQRTLCMLQAITQFPAFEKGKSLEGLLVLEKLVEDYERFSEEKLNNDLKVATLIRCCPQVLRQHLELTLTKETDYATIRQALTDFEQTRSAWTTEKVLKQAQEFANQDDPMDVDRVQWKGTQKGKGKEKPKGKGKGKDGKGPSKSKGKGKSSQPGSSKGKSKGKGEKGEGKGKQQKETRECYVCKRTGHLAKDCWDNDKKVRMVEEEHSSPSVSSSTSTTSTSPSTTLRTPGMVRRVTCAIKKLVTPPGMVPCDIYDLAEEDDDVAGDDSPLNELIEEYNVFAIVEDNVPEEQAKSVEFQAILDLGADVSVLPLKFGKFAEVTNDRYQALLRDAQGNLIQNYGRVYLTMLVETEDGEVIGLKETFVLANVKQPLVAVGKWLKKGWMIQRREEQGQAHYLAIGLRRIPLVWKGNSLAFTFATKVLEVNFVVELGTELEELAKERGSWVMEDGTPVYILKRGSTFQEPTVPFVMDNYPYRTTLVKLEDDQWHCVEYEEHKDQWRTGPIPEVKVLTRIIAIFHQNAVQPQGAGDFLPLEEQPHAGLSPLEDVQMQAEAAQGGDLLPEGPPPEDAMADDGAEVQGPDGAMADQVGDGHVIVNGKRIEQTSTLKVMREACVFLGLGRSGGKKTIFARLQEYCQRGHARLAVEVAHQQQQQDRREPEAGPAVPELPDEETQARHRLTHLPFESWCEECVATRSRDGERHERREAPVPSIALDYMFTSTRAGHQHESEMLKHLVGVDSWTKAILCVPIPGKGGLSLKRCVTAVTAFARDYEDVILKGDGEPAMKQLIEAVQATRTALKQKTKVEYAPPGHHQSNPAERAIQTTRRLGNTLLESVSKGTGQQLGGDHLLRVWAYSHAAWLYNRFHVNAGSKQTPFEVAADRPYRGRLTEFGTAVYGQPLPHKPQQRKGTPNWEKGIFVGKLPDCDLSIVCGVRGLFLTRGVRRCAQRWQADLLAVVRGLPWEERETPGPKPGRKKQLRDRAAMMEEVMEHYRGDEEAQAIALYARQRVTDALDAGQGQAVDGSEEAPSEASGGLQQQPAEGVEAEGQASEAGIVEDEAEVQGGRQPFAVKRGPEGAQGEPQQKQPREGTSTPLPFKRMAVDEPTMETLGTTKALRLADAKEPLDKSSRTTPTTPMLPLPTSPTSSSPTRLSASPTFAGNLGHISRVQLGEDEVEVDEEYILDPTEWGDWENLDLSEWDRSEDDGPPNLTDDELYKLDFEAEEIEISRLLEMGVLIAVDKENVIDETYRKLTTKHVKDWRFRDGRWLRRSRLVARDYKFLEPELEGLFSPASNALSTKLWAAVVQSAGGELNLYSADIKDAYLMVEQDEKVYVTMTSGVHYILGRCLPGQRVGSKSWYDLLALVIKDFGLLTYKANPSVFYKPILNKFDKPLVVSTHVDDLQVMGTEKDVNDLFQHFRDQGWKLQVEGPCGPHLNGQCTFLKRKFVTDGDGNMWIKLNDKYIHKLVEELNLGNNKSKAVPTTSSFRKGYEYQSLSPEKARVFRTCVGILLYMASERPGIQCATRALASKVTNPDEGDWKELKQVVLYLKDTADYAQRMRLRSSMASSMKEMAYKDFGEEVTTSACNGPSLLEVYTDADWAGDRSTRRSCSCAVFYLNNNYFFAVTRTQRSIALSSAESEFVAAVSAAADAIYVKRLLETVLNTTVFLEMRLDNAAARALLQRQGVQRTRHIATGLL